MLRLADVLERFLDRIALLRVGERHRLRDVPAKLPRIALGLGELAVVVGALEPHLGAHIGQTAAALGGGEQIQRVNAEPAGIMAEFGVAEAERYGEDVGAHAGIEIGRSLEHSVGRDHPHDLPFPHIEPRRRLRV